MQLLKSNLKINFMGRRKLAMMLSLLMLGACIASLAIQQLQLGIDFSGGTVVEVGFAEPVPLDEVRTVLAKAGFDDKTQVQEFGSPTEVLLRLPPNEELARGELSEKVLKTLEAEWPKVENRRVEFVGPQVGEELRDDGGLAIMFALICILLYVGLRFEWRFALGAIAALVHDVLLVVGFFSLTRLDFDLSVLAAVLAVIGYSLNDTIVVFDRIREDFRAERSADVDTQMVMNAAINETLSRTLITSLTTLLVLGALVLIGGKAIAGFAIALIVGVLVGTYSSIFVASASALALGVSRADLIPPPKENPEDVDGMP